MGGWTQGGMRPLGVHPYKRAEVIGLHFKVKIYALVPWWCWDA